MIEKLARAIADKRGMPEEQRTEGMMAVFRMDVRACLEALREPSDAQIAAGVDVRNSEGDDLDPVMVERVWQSMIDVALLEDR